MLEFFNNNPAIVSILTLAISVGVIYTGWHVLFNNAKILATRNETYGLITQTSSLLEELTNSAIVIWSTENASANLQLQASSQVAKVQQFKRKLDLLQQRGLQIDVSSNLKRLRKAITLDIERVDTVSVVKKESKIKDIHFYSSELTHTLYQAFIKKYPAQK